MTTTTTPNSALRAARIGRNLSQSGLARLLREYGARVGVPNDASKRLVQRWEAGTSTKPRPEYAEALEQVMGLPLALLGFSVVDSVVNGGASGPDQGRATTDMRIFTAPFTGVWLSRYTYVSSGRGNAEFTGLHYVVLLQHRSRLTVRSLPASADSTLAMDLSVEGTVVTGTWSEQTSVESYYRGAKYFGAIQMIADPTGHRLNGRWLGFGKEGEINSGPWSLTFQSADTSRDALARYGRPEPAE
jgi:transcriptional regulator with XRE-family HTH domain